MPPASPSKKARLTPKITRFYVPANIALRSLTNRDQNGRATPSIWERTLSKIHNLDAMQGQLRINPKCFEMGKFAVVVALSAYFLERLFTKLKDLDLAAVGRLVTYYDEASFSGEIASSDIEFSKQKCFSHQREWRLRVNFNTGAQDAKTIDIGNLPEGSFKLPASEFHRLNGMILVPKEPILSP